MAQDTSVERIRELNDALRRDSEGGQVLITSGVEALGADSVGQILAAVAGFQDFTPDNDPYGEHDFGALTFSGRKIFWKIDYYDNDLKMASPDPADPIVTSRVLTIMLAEEY